MFLKGIYLCSHLVRFDLKVGRNRIRFFKRVVLQNLCCRVCTYWCEGFKAIDTKVNYLSARLSLTRQIALWPKIYKEFEKEESCQDWDAFSGHRTKVEQGCCQSLTFKEELQ